MLGSSAFRLMCFYARVHGRLRVYAHGSVLGRGQSRFGGSGNGLGSLSLVVRGGFWARWASLISSGVGGTRAPGRTSRG